MSLNLFGHHFESAATGVETEDGVYDVLENPESGSVSEAILEVTEEANAVAREDAALDQLHEGEEAIAEVQDVVRASVGEGNAVDEAGEVTTERLPSSESYGLSAVDSRLVKILMKRHTGARYAHKTMPNMESFSTRANARDVTQRFVQEGIKETLKRFWEAIKAQFNKLWSKIKTWYVKTFSASKKLRDKAEKLLDKVNGMSTTIEHKSFAFSQAASVAIGGKAKNSTEISKGAKALASILADILAVPTDSVLDAVEKALTDAEQEINSKVKNATSGTDQETELGAVFNTYATAVTAATKNYKAVITDTSAPTGFEDKVLRGFGAAQNMPNGQNRTHDAKYTAAFPGDWLAIYLEPTTNTDVARVAIINTKEKPKEYDSSTEVQTLSTSEMRDILGAISDGCETIFQYEKKWEKVDKAKREIEKTADELIKTAEDFLEDNGKDGLKGRYEGVVRKLARDTVKTTKTYGGFPASLSGKAMTTFSALYNYCEQSISNYRK